MTATVYLKSIACSSLLLLMSSCSNNSNPIDNQNASGDLNARSDQSEQVLRIAAAANLAGVLPSVIDDYSQNFANKDSTEASNYPKIEVTYASSGKLYAQINSGAPYDIFLSADKDYPAKYVQQHQNQTEQNSAKQTQQPFTYAQGQLALYSSKHPLNIKPNTDEPNGQDTQDTQLTQLINNSLAEHPTLKIAIANPELAPYGASAKAFLTQQGLYQTLSTNNHIIQAENISQAFQYTHTASTDYGFVALSQLISADINPNQYIRLAPESYPAILQDGIVISQHPKAIEFSHYLQSDSAQQLFAKAGYLPIKKS